MMRGSFAGFFQLLKITTWRSAKYTTPWMLAVFILAVSSYAAYEQVFPTVKDQQVLAQTIESNPAFNLVFGTAADLLSAEGFTVWRTVVLGGFLLGLMSILNVVRLTRAKEDSGETELLQANGVGRLTIPTVAVTVTILANVVTGLVAAGALLRFGSSAEVAWLIGGSLITAGVVFTALAVFCAQLTSSARTAATYALSFLGISYLLRGFVDTVDGSEWIGFVSPLYWVQRADITGANNVMPLLGVLLFLVAVLIVTLEIKKRRDYGQGLIADKPGRKEAALAKNLSGFMFKFNLQSLTAWIVASIFIGSMFGYILSSVSDGLAGSSALQNFTGAGQDSNILFEFARTQLTIFGIIIAVAGVQFMSKLRSEEMDYRIEPFLSGSISRRKLFLHYVALSFGIAVIGHVLTGGMMAFVSTLQDSTLSSADIILQSLATLPATLLLVSVSVLLVGMWPKLKVLAWLGVALSFAISLLGPILQVNDRILALSPYWHVANTSMQDSSFLGSLVLLMFAIILAFIGLAGFKKRDIARI